MGGLAPVVNNNASGVITTVNFTLGVGSYTNANGSALNISGNASNAGAFTATAATNTVKYNGASNQTAIAAAYYNLTIDNSGAASNNIGCFT